MKKVLRKLILATITTASALTATAQQVSTFDNLTLAPNSYWDGSKTKVKTDTVNIDTTFLSGDAIFFNRYSRLYPKYPYWQKGWAYSNVKDVTTPNKLFNSYAGGGYNSDNYAVGQNNAIVRLNDNAKNYQVKGVYVTNGTYAALSMKNGDSFARKFGDTTGTKSGLPQGSYPDWFKLTIKGYTNGALKADSVEFYLADYRFTDNSKDYIVNTWQFVDLSKLGKVDSVIFKLSSSDNGMYGMNTPAFFCIDDFTTAGATGIASIDQAAVKIYPNPATDNLIIDLSALNGQNVNTIDILDISGRKIETIVVNSSVINLSLADYKAGAYLITVKNNTAVINAKFIKN